MGLNKEQQRAVDSNSDRILCLAPAGSGKTQVVIHRISRLVADGVDPTSILALTFTNAAGAEMRERFERANSGALSPEFKTFHAFCYSIVCKDPEIRNALGYTEIPNIASDEQASAIEKQVMTQCKISITKDQLTNRSNLTKKEQFQVDLYDKALSRAMRSANLITFDMLNQRVAELFAEDFPATKKYKDKYRYILVDEFQDVDPYQMKFLNSFPEATNFFCVGDTLQNIYHFRGTTNEYIKLITTAPGWDVIKLLTNYRSTNQICKYANDFSASYADAAYRVEMQGIRDGEDVVTRYVNGPNKYSAIDTSDIDNVLEELPKLTGNSAILCRTNKEVYAITAYLKEHNVEFFTTKDNKMQKLLECVMSDIYTIEYLAAQLPSQKYGEYIRLSAKSDNPDLPWFIENYGNLPAIKSTLQKINAIRKIANTDLPISYKLAEFSKETGVTAPVPQVNYSGMRFVQYLHDNLPKVQASSLYVGTIHSVKGLEYDNVFVMNVGSYNFRLNNEDMKNLFYVAITRAKNRLYVYKILV